MSIRWHKSHETCPHSNDDVCPTCDFDRYYANTYPDCPWRDEPEYYPNCLGCAKGDCWGPDDNGRCGCCGRVVDAATTGDAR